MKLPFLKYWHNCKVNDTVGPGGHGPPHFCIAKRKKGNKGKKERFSKQKLWKGCHQGQNVTVLAILEHLEFKNFSGQPTMVSNNICQCSMPPPPPWNPFRQPWIVSKNLWEITPIMTLKLSAWQTQFSRNEIWMNNT